MTTLLIVSGVIIAVLALVALYDITQRRHSILRNFPVVGHLRFVLERFGPELRQYIVTNNDEERPFSRDQRRWVYATAKRENPYFGFGTDNDIDRPGNLLIGHSPFPLASPERDEHDVACAKIVGAWRDRPRAFRPASIVNISAMSFGSLSANAIEALNRAAAVAGCWHNTGEGGVSRHHLHGGDLVYQVGTGYFGCRDQLGRFSLDQLCETVAKGPVLAVEIKLSQGAKPGLGGVLPAEKVTAEIAEARGVPMGVTVHSPSGHSQFDDVASLVEFIETVAAATGLPVGIKAAVGQPLFWDELAEHMARTGRGPDFITVDGGEGGTGAAPLVFSDHVALPFRDAMATVYRAFASHGMHHHVVFVGSAKLGFPQQAIAAFSLGADVIGVAREAMLAIGCIQAQRCHTGHCPTGVATQNAWLARGLDPTDKAARAANYVMALRQEILKVSRACGVTHPALLPRDVVQIVSEDGRIEPLAARHGLDPTVDRLDPADLRALKEATA